jgi:hypothetical protein
MTEANHGLPVVNGRYIAKGAKKVYVADENRFFERYKLKNKGKTVCIIIRLTADFH